MKRILYCTAAAVALTLGACSNTPTSQPALPAPVTFEEATLLAGALNANANAGTAGFTAAYQPATGAPFKLEGVVNWTELTGEGTAFVPTSTATFEWTEQGVTITESGQATSHTPNPDSNPIDYTITAIMNLASRQADNPSLVQQNGATITERDDQTSTFVITAEPNSPRLTINNETGTVHQAILPIPAGGHLTITFNFEAQR